MADAVSLNAHSTTAVTGPGTGVRAPEPAADEEARLRDAAKRFEQSFIAQMLVYSGLADSLTSGDGKGAEAFTTFYIDQLAERLADQGGFGLADTIYKRLAVYQDRNDAPPEIDKGL
ncbi:rod-binding protein [Aquisalinus flavus]|uniref:Flagellar protein FlgJ N-terminal domain-containing protein n=1 Tax=Aquisalinus flavus TaxID=1526572 RepID=A0A8J2V1U0_9PROT|nr:rod-binding protein [Aquisalinus flavus]MBD0425910.1 rod-binding protein [Aquisalinus flavus]UNE48496.1 flagellar biosynthesis protein FlgJ [Aquisalinus flavus]GGD12307.1 hypothetical protein GCM10011342_21340 [Aquisalinus flavus]